MNNEVLTKTYEGQQEILWEMREYMLILQNAHVAITAILQKNGDNTGDLNLTMIEILAEEIFLMNVVNEKMHMSIQKMHKSILQKA